jgi:hypothetical protein
VTSRALNDRSLRALKPKITLYDVPDGIVPGMAVRVSPKGRKTFVLVARYGGSAHPTRRALGVYGAVTIEQARGKARSWIEAIQKGQDPALQEERERVAQIASEKVTFDAVVEDFTRDKLTKERKGDDARREIDLDLMPAWKAKPIGDITDLDIIEIINRKKRKTVVAGKKRGGPTGARNLLALIKRFFRWVVGQRIYGLTESPAKDLSAKVLIGDEVSRSRDRILSDDELFAFWRVTGRMPYPVGPAYRLLLVAALRLREAVDVQRQELDPIVVQRLDAAKPGIAVAWRDLPADRTIWVIPKERMKGRNSGKRAARPHAVPMTDEIMQLFASIPRLKGKYLFSTTGGNRPVSVGSKIKIELDQRMLRTLRALARMRGLDPHNVVLPPWVNHDLRRTVRSHLSRLRIEEVAREAAIAHARPGIKGVYDLYDYLEEKREALQLWAARLRTIVEPVPNNGVAIAIKNLMSA